MSLKKKLFHSFFYVLDVAFSLRYFNHSFSGIVMCNRSLIIFKLVVGKRLNAYIKKYYQHFKKHKIILRNWNFYIN